MSLLPSEPDTTAAEESSPRVVGVDSEAADDLIAALSSETARDILAALHEEPAPPSTLADRVGTTLQNVQYHLENLAAAGAVEVVDTAYSEKGREMDVYAPADRPLVIFAGEQSRTPSLRKALSRLLGAVGVLAVASLAVQALFGRDGGFGVSSEPPTGYSGANQSGLTTAPQEPTTAPAADDAADAPETRTAVDGGAADATAEPPETVAESTETAVNTINETMREPTRRTTETAVETTTEAVDAVGGAVPDPVGLPPGLLFFLGGLTALLVVAILWYGMR